MLEFDGAPQISDNARARLEHHLGRPIASGKEVVIPEYSYISAEASGNLQRIDPSPSRNVVVDGLYASEVTSGYEGFFNFNICHVKLDTPMYVSLIRRMLRETSAKSDSVQRQTQFTPEENLQYLVDKALPTYIREQANLTYDYLVHFAYPCIS